MSTTIAELASRLNLSKGSVSRILNDKGQGFSEETRRRVFALADEIGYRPNAVARALATGRTGFIGLWVHDLRTAYHAHVAHQMEDCLERHGYRVFISLYNKTYRNPQELPPFLPIAPDGIIAHEIWGEHSSVLFHQLAEKIPIITTGAWAPKETIDHVGVDLFPASISAMQHLVGSGRQRIAYLTDVKASDARYEAYSSILRESGLPEELIESGSENRATVRQKVRSYIEEKGCPEAIFCHNDDIAIGAYRAICDLGFSLPADVALVGCDGVEDTEYLHTPLTTIVQPLPELCEIAAHFLERRLAEPDAPPQHAVLIPQLVIRESSQY